ncbi:MAG: glycosyl hydrolase [Planctomycetota bacterium]|nr:glycosyl hydrolase [Planctomycetota bacterium]
MVSTWIESSAKGRLGGPVRAGMWSAVVVGTHPIEANQEVWLELTADDKPVGSLPGYWLENKGVNSLWHVPIPPQGVGARLHYRPVARRNGNETVRGEYHDTVVRPNLPDRTETPEVVSLDPEGLTGNRQMTVRVDARGSTYDVYFPSAGLHGDVRPAEGDLTRSRAHFHVIAGGLAVGRRLDWFSERQSWDAFQHYQGATNLLTTELTWRHGPVRVIACDFVAMGSLLPKTAGGVESPGQYLKRYRITNGGEVDREAVFGLYVRAAVNGGVGEAGLSWHDGERALLAFNRGHAHANRKLARDATVEFAVALDAQGDVDCETTGVDQAILIRKLRLPAGQTVTLDVLVSGAYTGWRGDLGTFEHWLRPALKWFRSIDLDEVEQTTAQEWDAYIEPVPNPQFPKPSYAVTLRRSSLALALHADAEHGSIASDYDRGLSAYCWPREANSVAGTFERLGHPEIGRAAFQWLLKVRGKNRAYGYWFQKYTMDGMPEWETPAVDQTALLPWGVERHFRRTGDADFVTACLPMIEQAAEVCRGAGNHPGLRWIDDLNLVSSAGIWDQRFGAFFYSNACVVAGLRSAAALVRALGRDDYPAARWSALADLVWNVGVLGKVDPDAPSTAEPGLIDHDRDRFLEARRLSTRQGLWADQPSERLERDAMLDVSLLGAVVPLGLIAASDPLMVNTAEAILKYNVVDNDGPILARTAFDPTLGLHQPAPLRDARSREPSALATLWTARYLLALGRETSQARHWTRALAMLDALLARLEPLGLTPRLEGRRSDPHRGSASKSSGAWGLHAPLVETLLDFAGLEYDAVDRRLVLDPVLPSAWPHIGLSRFFPCGDVTYRLERPIGAGVYQLTLLTRLKHAVVLDVAVTSPGLADMGPFRASHPTTPPAFQRATGRVAWSCPIPEGESSLSWIWG